MAYNKQYVSLSRVIENAYRRSGEDVIDWEAAIEWTAALIRIIGVPSSYIQKSTNGQGNNPIPIEIIGHRGILPNDIIVRGSCRRISLNNDNIPYKMAAMIESNDVFFETTIEPNINNSVFFDPTYNGIMVDEDGVGQPTTFTQAANNFGSSSTYEYKIEGNIIFTSFETGYVEMSYKGFMIDEKGLPMIPDDEKYIRAVMWELISNLDYKKWRKNPNNTGLRAIYNDSNRERDWAVGAAITKGRIPTLDEMESIKNSWIRSIPRINEHATNFKTINKQEIRYTQNRK